MIDMDNDIKVSCGEAGGSYFITVDDVRYKCSYAESAILNKMLQNKGDFYSKEELATIGWPGKLVSKNSVPVSMANLRKIFKNHTKLDVITNEKNKGYVIIVDKVKLTGTTETTETEIQYEQPAISDVNRAPPASIDGGNQSKISNIKLIMSKGLAYPLLAVNIAFLLLILFYNQIDLEPFQVNVIKSDNYIAVSTNDNNFLAKLNKNKINQQNEHNSFTSIENDLILAKQESKNILFINSLGDRVVIDCLVDNKLVSYSGDDIEAIISELNEKGCKI